MQQAVQDTLAQQIQAAIPNAQERITALIVILFLLAILALLIYMQMRVSDERLENLEKAPNVGGRTDPKGANR